MNKILIEDLVKVVLEQNEEARADDFLLILEVYKHFQPFIGGMCFKDVFEKHKQLGLPSMHSITRCRRRVFEMHPELKPKDNAPRIKEEADFLGYVRG